MSATGLELLTIAAQIIWASPDFGPLRLPKIHVHVRNALSDPLSSKKLGIKQTTQKDGRTFCLSQLSVGKQEQDLNASAWRQFANIGASLRFVNAIFSLSIIL